MPKLDKISHNISIPDGVNINLEGPVVTVSKDGKSLKRKGVFPNISLFSALKL